MSKRNLSGKHISKDKIPVKDIRKNDIPKDGKSRDGREQKAGQEKWGRSGKGGGAMYGLCTVLWMLLCAALLVRIWFLNRTTESLRTRIADLTQMIARQQDRLEELAQMAGVDISTDAPLLDTIETIGGYIDEICRLTEELA